MIVEILPFTESQRAVGIDNSDPLIITLLRGMERQLNIGRVFSFAAILFLVQVTVSAAATLIAGADNLNSFRFYEYVLFLYLPVLFFSAVVFTIFATKQAEYLWLHALMVLVSTEIFGFLVISLIMQEFYLAPTWPVELSVSFFALLVGSVVGTKVWGVQPSAT